VVSVNQFNDPLEASDGSHSRLAPPNERLSADFGFKVLAGDDLRVRAFNISEYILRGVSA